jgi:hypothetical protein
MDDPLPEKKAADALDTIDSEPGRPGMTKNNEDTDVLP